LEQYSGRLKPLKTHIFYCSNNLEAGQLADLCSALPGVSIKTIGLPCSGKVDIPYFMKAFETGADGVVVVACPKDECRNFEGSARAHKRAEAVEALLEEIGAGAGRMAVFECGKGDAGKVAGDIRQFVGQLRKSVVA
jgi:coenzyme F420-reducing hydrogenase delta subunit